VKRIAIKIGSNVLTDAQGLLNMFAVDKKGLKLPGNHAGDKERVPEFERMQGMAKRIAPYFFYQRCFKWTLLSLY